jgi:hypothetical protein
MKSMHIYILSVMLLLPTQLLADTYFVSKTGSNTAPYNTEAKAASALKTVIDYLRQNGSGNDTVRIGVGVYTSNGYALLDNTRLNNLIIVGAGRSATVLSPSAAHVVAITAGISVSINDLTLKPDSTHASILMANAAATGAFNRVDLIASDNYTWHLLHNMGGTITADACRLYHQYSPTNIRNIVYFQNNASGRFTNCQSMAAQQAKATGTWLLAGTGAVTIANSAILDAQSYAVTVIGSGPVTIRNSILSGGMVRSDAATISTGNKAVTLANNLLISPPWSNTYKGIAGSYTNGGGNLFNNANPDFSSFRRKGYILPRIDDSVNFKYAHFTVAPVLRRFGFTGSVYLTGHDWDYFGDNALLRAMVQEGTVEAASHSNTHSDLQLTGAIAAVTRAADTVAVDRAADTISISGGGSVAGFRSKTLGQIRNELQALGATVVPSVPWDLSSPGSIKSNTTGEVLDNLTAGNSLKLLIDPTAATGYFKVEIADTKDSLTNLVNASGTVLDGQTGEPYVCNGFAFPYNNESGDARSAVMAKGFAYGAGRNQIGNGSSGDLEWVGHFDAYGIPSLGPGYILGADEATTRANARTWGFAAAHTGLIIALLMHGDFSMEQLNWIFEEWAAFGDNLKVLSHQSFMAEVRVSGLWNDNGDGTFSRSYENGSGDFSLRDDSALIGAGAAVSGLTVDFLGRAWSTPPDIGAYAHSDSTPPVVSISSPAGTYPTGSSITLAASEAATIYYTFDGSMPTTSSSIYQGPIILDHSCTLTFFAVDAAGNASGINSAAFTITGAPPAVPVPSLGWPGMLAAVSGLLLLMMRRAQPCGS